MTKKAQLRTRVDLGALVVGVAFKPNALANIKVASLRGRARAVTA